MHIMHISSSTWDFQEYSRNSRWNFQGLIKSDMELPGVIKKNRGISSSGIGSFRPLRISEGFGGFLAVKRRALVCLWNFQGQSKKPKNSREFQKSMTSLPLFEFFSDILTQNQSVSYMSCRLFQKKSKERGWRCTFWKKKPWSF